MSPSLDDEVLALCAVSTSGELTEVERKRLQEHLAVCPSCQEAMNQFDAVVSKAIPALARDPGQVESDPSRSQEQAEAALNLDVFYVDNAAKKHWVLRFDDPKALAPIDAVFITVEPNGGSHKPTSKRPLLFAYLHVDPNHP